MNSKWLKLYNQLLKGKLTRDDQHQIEREALDDPFLADALEGIELYHDADRGALQDRLEQRLDSEIRPKLFKLWKYAAAASIVLVAGAFFFLKPDEMLSLDSEAYSQEIATPSSNDEIAIVLASEAISVGSIEDTAIHALISHGVQEVDITDSKVDRIHPKRKQLVISSDEAMVHVVSNTPESDIGLSTHAIVNASDHANSQLSYKLKTARVRAIPAPAMMPIGLSESDDPMPVHESIEIAYIPNHQTVYGTDTFPQLIVPKVDLKNAIPVAELESGIVLYNLTDSLSGELPEISINGRIIDLVNSNSPSILSNSLNPQPQLVTTDLRQLGNMLKRDTIDLTNDFDGLLQLETSPVIGWLAFDSILQSEVRRSSQMADQQGSLLINFDPVGNIQNWDAKGLPDSSVNTLLQKVGPWNINDQAPTVLYPFKVSTVETDTIKPNPSFKILIYDQYGSIIDDGYPLIGWAAFDSLLMTEMPNKEEMFLLGVKDGDLNRISLSIDSTGRVFQFHPGAMPTNGVQRVIDKTGKWYTQKQSAIIISEHKIFSKERK